MNLFIIMAALVFGVPITNTATIRHVPKEVTAMAVGYPGIYPNNYILLLDTNVFKYDSNRDVVTLIQGIGSGTLVPITDNSYDIGSPIKYKTFIKIGGRYYVKLNLALGIMTGMFIGGILGVRAGIKKEFK